MICYTLEKVGIRIFFDEIKLGRDTEDCQYQVFKIDPKKATFNPDGNACEFTVIDKNTGQIYCTVFDIETIYKNASHFMRMDVYIRQEFLSRLMLEYKVQDEKPDDIMFFMPSTDCCGLFRQLVDYKNCEILANGSINDNRYGRTFKGQDVLMVIHDGGYIIMKTIIENGMTTYSQYKNVRGLIGVKDYEPSEEIREYWEKEKKEEEKSLRQALRRLLSIVKIAKK
jgi:hypothetical protein